MLASPAAAKCPVSGGRPSTSSEGFNVGLQRHHEVVDNDDDQPAASQEPGLLYTSSLPSSNIMNWISVEVLPHCLESKVKAIGTCFLP